MADENEVVVDNDELEVELVDDTPPEDQGRRNLPEPVVKRLEEEDDLDGDVEEVRRKAKEKLSIAKKAWHDERRAREEAQRIADEATNLARGYQARSLDQAKRLVTGEQYLITQMQDKVKQEVAMAKKAYKEAYESGDSDALAEAQELLNRATNNAMEVEKWKPTQQTALQQIENEVQTQPQAARAPQTAPVLDEKAQAWASKNQWFGRDDALGRKMTGYAVLVHKTMVDDGVDPTSDGYYKQLDREMRERFPEGFSAQAPSTTVVASVQRSAKGKKVTLTQTQASLAKRLGLTNEQYARELIKTREYANG
jgi:hypothetical protein